MTRRLFTAVAAATAAVRGQRTAPLVDTRGPEGDIVLLAMADEMTRSRTLATLIGDRPYFIQYALWDGDSYSGSATLGALIHSRRSRYRVPRIQVRVGNYQFDNTDYVGTDFFTGPRYDLDQFPLDNSLWALRQHLWLATDAAYKGAVEAISRKRAALKNVAAGADSLPDFSPAEPVRTILSPRSWAVSEEAWEARLRRLSGVFLQFPGVTASTVDVEGGPSTHYIVTSEGTLVRVPEGMIAVRVRAAAQAPDGMTLRDAVVFHGPDPEALPSEVEMERRTRQVAENLAALAAAPAGESYTGPVLFEGLAAAQIFAEVLGKNLAVPRRPVSQPGRPAPFAPSELEGRLGSRILPEWMDVVDDPTQTEWRGRPLFGHYQVDLEGVIPKPLVLVEKGVLKSFLLTRQPVAGAAGSNGHARLPGLFGHHAAGCGNLFVKAAESAPSADLKRKLIEMCRQRNKPYGLIIRKMDFPSSASFDEVRRLLAGAGETGGGPRPVSLPVLVYRVYADGREELVRGMRLRAFTSRSLKDIVAASDETFVFDFLDHNGPFAVMGGANFVSETSVIAPSVLIDDVEVDRIRQDYTRPPLVPPPPLT